MAYLTASARARPVVEARPRNESIVIKVGDALLVLDQAEALQLSADLIAIAGHADPEGISGDVAAFADRNLDAVVIAVSSRRVLNLSATAWTTLAMQGSSAALELRANRIRTGMRIGPLQRGNADLVEVPA